MRTADSFALALLTECLGLDLPVFVAPNVNPALARHPRFRASLDELAALDSTNPQTYQQIATLNQEIAQGHASSVMCHAGNIAWRTGKKLKFDAKTESFDDAEANRYLGREYRKGFELPKVD